MSALWATSNIWRALRKLDELPESGIALEAYNAADNGNWCEYVDLMAVTGHPERIGL